MTKHNNRKSASKNPEKPEQTTVYSEVLREVMVGLKQLEARLDRFEQTVDELRARLEVVEVALPSDLRTLSADAVAQAVEENPYVTLEVLEDCVFPAGVAFRKGDTIRADHYPHLVDYVRSGLKLGIPQDQSEHVRKLREQAQAQIEYAKAQLAAAKATAARAEAEISAVKVEDTAADARTIGGTATH